MRKNIFLLGALLAVSAATMAQTKQGGISAQMLSQIEKMQKTSAADKALFNAIAANSIDDLAKNYAAKRPVDTHFSNETPKQKIHNQRSSGRCWMFSGFNVLRANFAKQHQDSLCVEYSQAYLFFYDQLEKANLMLQGVIDNARKPIDDQRVRFFFQHPINDGGTFCGVADLAEKYGLVPMAVMPETYSSDNTSRMARIISSKLREYGLELRSMVAAGKKAQDIRKRKTEMLGTIYHILALTIGEPVQMEAYIRTANHLVIEANHDEHMLLNGPYPTYLKERILSPRGHQSNVTCGELIARNYHEGLRNIWLCHLSLENNDPQVAYNTVADRLRDAGIVPGEDVYLKALERTTPSRIYRLGNTILKDIPNE